MTVPTGIDSMSAISAYENSSTSRNHTASRKTAGSASSAACRSGQGLAKKDRFRRVGVDRRDASPLDAAGGAFDRVAVDVDVFPREIARAVARRVVEDGEQPRTKVRAGRELLRGAKGLEIGFLHQIFGVGRPMCEP